ncbi:hypothetical protein BC827DRAFT_1210670 [Russula dissimulans]|nr:hypothetical protein BC827DRAFT_1210670 [Russula dissimulans]
MQGGLSRKRSFNLLPGGSCGSLTLSLRLDPNFPGPERVTQSVDEFPTREPPVCTPKRTRTSNPALDPLTSPPGVTPEHPTTTLSVLINPPGGSSQVESDTTPLTQPTFGRPSTESTLSLSLSSRLDIITASSSPLGSESPSTDPTGNLSTNPVTSVEPLLYVSQPPEFLSHAEIEHVPDEALPVRQSDSIERHGHDGRQPPTGIPSLPEQGVFSPTTFPPHLACIPKKKTRTPNSVPPTPVTRANDFFPQEAFPTNAYHTSNASTTTLQNSEEPRPVPVISLPPSSRETKDQFTNTFESLQSPPVHFPERPTILMQERASIKATSSNFWNVPPIDVPHLWPSEVGCPMPVQTVHSYHSAAGKGKESSPRQILGYDTGAETSHQNTSTHGSKDSAQSGTISSPQNEGSMGSVPMAQWKECLLPDGFCYFSNPILDIVADFDLRNAEKLHAVTRFLEGHTEIPPPPGWGLWLRNASGSTTTFIPLLAWVHHEARMVVSARPASNLMGFIYNGIDRLDSEYQYWLFMMSHPVHALLPPESITKARELLMWTYTGRLLPPPHPPLAPFSQEECDVLLTQLGFFSQMSTQIISLNRTRVVSTVHVKIVAWRQGRWRPSGSVPPSRFYPSVRMSFERRASDRMG